MTTTDDLIAKLSNEARPVRRLHPPLLRAAGWIGLAGVILGLLAIEHGLRSDLANQFANVRFCACLAASLATGMLAAIASLIASLPDRSRLWLLLPLPPLAIWLSDIAYGCLTGWVAFDASRMAPGETLRCFATLLLVSLPLSAALLLMLRHTARLQPVMVTLTAGLGAGAIAASAMSLLHRLDDASLMVVLWSVGVAFVISGVNAIIGRQALTWFERILPP